MNVLSTSQSPLLLSCKITNSAMKFLERRGEELEPLYERFDWPLAYLRDSSSWLEADRLEYVLSTLEEIYGARVTRDLGIDFFEAIAHESPSLRAWGALDSVLRIVPTERDLFQQPERFLGSFLSPQPHIQDLKRTEESTTFRWLGLSEKSAAGRYMKAVFEALPAFIGKPRAHVHWYDGQVLIEWSDRQETFAVAAAGADAPALSPGLLESIRRDLANAQRELEESRRKLQEKDESIATLQRQATLLAEQGRANQGTMSSDRLRYQQALHEMFKLGDYFARAQQLVTLMRNSTSRSTLSSEALIRRTSWDRVSVEAPIAIRKASALLQGEPIEELAAPFVESVESTSSKASQKTHTPSLFDGEKSWL